MTTQPAGGESRYTGDMTSRPVPDPTVLTTEQLLREVAALRDLIQSDIEGLEAIVAEKFRSVDQQLQLVERQRVEQKKDTKDAVDAALTAQKEAVREQTTASERAIAKSEAAMTKQLEQLSETFKTAIGGLTDALSDIKDRVTVVESLKQGGREQRSDSSAMFGLVVGAIGALAAIGAIIALIVSNGTPAG